MPSLGSLLAKARLIAPEILIAEYANILWKKVRGKELSREEALLAARLLQGAALELLPIRSLLETATRIAIELDHPYDCVYIALAHDQANETNRRICAARATYRCCARAPTGQEVWVPTSSQNDWSRMSAIKNRSSR